MSIEKAEGIYTRPWNGRVLLWLGYIYKIYGASLAQRKPKPLLQKAGSE